MKLETKWRLAFFVFAAISSINCGQALKVDSQNTTSMNNVETSRPAVEIASTPDVFVQGQPAYSQLDSDQVTSALERWKSADLANYSYVISYRNFYGPGFEVKSYRVVARAHNVESVVPIVNSDVSLIREIPQFGTVEGMLKVVIAELGYEASVFGEFDEEFGYPKEIQIKKVTTNGMGSIVYYSFKISDFKVN